MDGTTIAARAVVLTTGTFLAGASTSASRATRAGASATAVERLAARLRELRFAVGRLKTGTPPRLDGRTLDYAAAAAAGRRAAAVFSFLGRREDHPAQVHCHITATNERTHEIIRARPTARRCSPASSRASARATARRSRTRSCGSPTKTAHQIFLEPEGSTRTKSTNGISTSLPPTCRYEFVRTIPRPRAGEIMRPGYAVEYDYF